MGEAQLLHLLLMAKFLQSKNRESQKKEY
jgi:hypothetical protein